MKRKGLLKNLCLLLVVVFITAGVMGGCGSNNSPAASESSSAVAQDSTAESTEPALEPVTLKWYVMGAKASITDDGLKAVLDEANKTIKSQINAELDLQVLDWGNFQDKMNMIVASGEDYDMSFTSGWFNLYVPNVNKGAYAPLDDAIQKYGKTLLEQYPQIVWDTLKVDGKIYAMPCRQQYSPAEGLYVRKDLADKYGFVPQGITKTEDLEAFFDKVKAGEPGIIPTYIPQSPGHKLYNSIRTAGFEQQIGSDTGLTVKLGDKDLKVVNMFETQEFKDFAVMMKRWNDKGYIRKDSAVYSLNADNITNDLKSGKFATVIQGFVAPHVAALAAQAAGGRECIPVITAAPSMVSPPGIYSNTAVNAKSKNIDRAVMLFDLMTKDVDLYNTILYGVEGKNYTKNSDGSISLIKDSGYGDGNGPPVPDYAIGNQFQGWVLKGTDPDLWKKQDDFAKDAIISPLVSLLYDNANVKTETANVASVIKEYLTPLDTGSVDIDKKIPEFVEKLKSAGIDKMIEDAQAQVNKIKK